MRTINASEEAYKRVMKELALLQSISDDHRVTITDALDRLLGIKEVPGE
jgi:hypothetical protein